jgi:hypothetical protein
MSSTCQLEPLFAGPLATLPPDLAIARRATQIRGRHYDRATRQIPLADAILLASAGPDDRIATADLDVLAVTHVEGLRSVELAGQG